MNPKKINNFMQKRLGNEPDEDLESVTGTNIAYKIGLVMGLFFIIFISYLAWNAIAPKFGITSLNFLEFLCLTWTLHFLARIIKGVKL